MNNVNVINIKRKYRKTMKQKYLKNKSTSLPPEVKVLGMADFLKLPPIYCQRNTLGRLNRQSKVFAQSQNLRSLQNVHVVRYMKDTAQHKKGVEVIADGNTRQEYWLAETALGKPIPPWVLAVYYEVWSDAEALALYNTFDNPGAVMNSADRIYSAYRAVGVADKFKSHKIRTGTGISKSLQYAALGRPSYPNYSSRISDYTNIIEDYQEELLVFDGLLAHRKGKLSNPHVICSALMLLKKYKSNQKKYSRLLDGLRKLQLEETSAGSKAEGYDGMTYLMLNLASAGQPDTLFPRGLSTTHHADWGFPAHQNAILLCFDRWLNNRTICRNRLPKKPVYDSKKGFWG